MVRIMNYKPEEKSIAFTQEELDKIAATLNKKKLNAETQKRLQYSLDNAVKWSCTTFYLKTKKERQKLERIKNEAAALRGELSDVLFSLLFLIDEKKYLDFINELSHIEKKAESELQLFTKKQGRKTENQPLKLLVEDLADVYKATTGKKPTLTKMAPRKSKSAQQTNKPGGAFYKFVYTFCSIVKEKFPHFQLPQGTLSNVIEIIIYPKNSSKNNLLF
ncbi:hypothetical protein KN63_00725 [Smithella sp. F21]|nr:hypothetical protein KN63_00725 [Smithella sp. F21]